MPKQQSVSHTTFSDTRHRIEQDLVNIYEKNQLSIGLPNHFKRIFSHLSRPNTVAIVGVALGDEGKGRIVDNKIEELLKNKRIEHVAVIRFQGGNNAGHTVEKDGTKLALHLIPSFVFHEQASGLMDRGMVVHVEDLQTEVGYVEDAVGSIRNRLVLSDDAILCTDLERAEEFLNGYLQEESKGGTGRGIGPSYAHHYDKTGLRIADLLSSDWEKRLTNRFEQYEKIFAAFGLTLSQTDVPDFATTVTNKKASKRGLGSKKEFLSRLHTSREWLLKRQIVTNTYPLHQRLSANKSVGIIFEGAQASGLDSWTGTRPDVTSSNTTVYGVREGTGFWTMQDIEERIGIVKLPYTSSVGARRMPTHINLPSTSPSPSRGRVSAEGGGVRGTSDQLWGQWIREEAHEYGTTTGRPRDINFLDLPFIIYNARMSGVEMLMGTHLDICREKDEIKICTHYKDKKGNRVPYQPGLRYLKEVTPNYIAIPGWDGKACQKAKNAEDLPIHALKFLSFIQKSLNYPFIATTTGPSRKDFITF
ncbi:MAG: adenylosuccinate synthetase [bacterium]|nr:adenylosuccinate synthetase [bacterium]